MFYLLTYFLLYTHRMWPSCEPLGAKRSRFANWVLRKRSVPSSSCTDRRRRTETRSRPNPVHERTCPCKQRLNSRSDSKWTRFICRVANASTWSCLRVQSSNLRLKVNINKTMMDNDGYWLVDIVELLRFYDLSSSSSLPPRKWQLIVTKLS